MPRRRAREHVAPTGLATPLATRRQGVLGFGSIDFALAHRHGVAHGGVPTAAQTGAAGLHVPRSTPGHPVCPEPAFPRQEIAMATTDQGQQRTGLGGAPNSPAGSGSAAGGSAQDEGADGGSSGAASVGNGSGGTDAGAGPGSPAAREDARERSGGRS
jgi:hypothetical protein